MLVHFKALAEGKHIIKLEIGCEEETAKDGSMIAEATGEFEFIVTKDHLPPAHKKWSGVMPFNTLSHLQKGIP